MFGDRALGNLPSDIEKNRTQTLAEKEDAAAHEEDLASPN